MKIIFRFLDFTSRWLCRRDYVEMITNEVENKSRNWKFSINLELFHTLLLLSRCYFLPLLSHISILDVSRDLIFYFLFLPQICYQHERRELRILLSLCIQMCLNLHMKFLFHFPPQFSHMITTTVAMMMMMMRKFFIFIHFWTFSWKFSRFLPSFPFEISLWISNAKWENN